MAKSGYLGEPQALTGTLSNPDNLRGTLSDPEGLKGTLEGMLVRGYSAYDIARALGYVGTEAEWIDSLKGEKGDPGPKGDSYVLTEQDKEDIADLVPAPEAPVTDVQINGTSILSDGVANMPIMAAGTLGVATISGGYGIGISPTGHNLLISKAGSSAIKGGVNGYSPIVPQKQNESVFYGLAKASGDTTQSQSDNAVGTYTDEAKASIKNMLGVQDGMVVNATLMSDPWYSVDKTYAEIGLAVADGINVVILSDGKVFPYAGMMYFQSVPVITFGSFFAYDGKLVSIGFIVTMDDNDATIAQKIQSETTIPTFNDVQINGTSVVTNGVANVPIANYGNAGVFYSIQYRGLKFNSNDNTWGLDWSSLDHIKQGGRLYEPLATGYQHAAAFYGLAKAAGDTTQSQSSNAVGTYTEEAKTAIRTMLGIETLSEIISAVHDSYGSAEGVSF